MFWAIDWLRFALDEIRRSALAYLSFDDDELKMFRAGSKGNFFLQPGTSVKKVTTP